MTIVNNTNWATTGTGGCPTIYEANVLEEGAPAMIFDLPPSVLAGDTETVLAPLYKGVCFWMLAPGFGSGGREYQVSGSATLIQGADPCASITGNCTITITAQSQPAG